MKYKGYQIPKWNEAINTAKALANILPNHKYIGWDLALTDNGWIMIEGNWGTFDYVQMATQKGYRAEFTRLMES
jgi:hypothetical protein